METNEMNNVKEKKVGLWDKVKNVLNDDRTFNVALVIMGTCTVALVANLMGYDKGWKDGSKAGYSKGYWKGRGGYYDTNELDK